MLPWPKWTLAVNFVLGAQHAGRGSRGSGSRPAGHRCRYDVRGTVSIWDYWIPMDLKIKCDIQDRLRLT